MGACQPEAKYLSIDGASNRGLINILLILIWRKHDTKYQFFLKKYAAVILFSHFHILCITFFQKKYYRKIV